MHRMLQASVEVKNALHGESLKGAYQFLSLKKRKKLLDLKQMASYHTLSLPLVFKRYHLT